MERSFPKLSASTRRWLQFAGLVLALGILCALAYGLRTVFTPLVAAAVIAYILNPLVTWCERHHHVPRLTTVIITFALLSALLLTGGFYAGSKTVAQIAELQQRVPAYIEMLGDWVSSIRVRLHGVSAWPATETTATLPGADAWPWVAALLQQHGVALTRALLDYVGTVFANLATIGTLLVLIPLFSFYFLWRYNDIVRVIHDHLPAMHRPRIVYMVTTIDVAVARFFRGRLIVCLVVGALLALGWSVIGVPYSVLLGMSAAFLNLVPLLSLLVLPPALLFAFLGANQAGVPWAWPVLLAMVVYMAVQAIDAFVLTPAIQGQAAGLHPLVVVIALLIGGQLAGLLGLLLAIPITSTLKTLAAEWVLPEVRRLAQPAPGTDKSGNATVTCQSHDASEPEP
jgi:predicted PurR-regulated permease PerM